ncbi:hypothetical protein FDECE_2003 [Fusarium decemcellulare]|nr:hypothetical protein FDECE_2003 [Fusarium decemcellulare]
MRRCYYQLRFTLSFVPSISHKLEVPSSHEIYTSRPCPTNSNPSNDLSPILAMAAAASHQANLLEPNPEDATPPDPGEHPASVQDKLSVSIPGHIHTFSYPESFHSRGIRIPPSGKVEQISTLGFKTVEILHHGPTNLFASDCFFCHGTSAAGAIDLPRSPLKDGMHNALEGPFEHRHIPGTCKVDAIIFSTSMTVYKMIISAATTDDQDNPYGQMQVTPTDYAEPLNLRSKPTRPIYNVDDSSLDTYIRFSYTIRRHGQSSILWKAAAPLLNESFGNPLHSASPLVALIPIPSLCYLFATQLHGRLNPFLALGILIFQRRRQLKADLLRIRDVCLRLVPDSPAASPRRARRGNRKLAFILATLFSGDPVVAVAWSLSRTLRIASGVVASGTGAAVIPLRTIDGVSVWAWATLVSTSHLSKLVSFTDHPPRRDYTVWTTSETLIEGFTVFGPVVLTISTFLVGLLFSATVGARRDDGSGEGNNTDATNTTNMVMTAFEICA